MCIWVGFSYSWAELLLVTGCQLIQWYGNMCAWFYAPDRKDLRQICKFALADSMSSFLASNNKADRAI